MRSLPKIYRRFMVVLLFVFLLGLVGFIFLGKQRAQQAVAPLPTQIVQVSPSASPAVLPQVSHIAIIVLENKNSASILLNQQAPYLNQLIRQGAFASNYFAVAHPSLPNYLALIGGQTFGISSDCTSCFVNGKNLTDLLAQQQKSWKAYMESMPKSCFVGSSGTYAQKHNPFIYFNAIRTNTAACANIVPFTQLSADLASPSATPNFLWITPNLCNDMHDCSVATGDTWLAKTVPQILQSPAFRQNSLVIITFDEAENSNDNRVVTVLTGTAVKPGCTLINQLSHYSMLATIEQLWQLPPLTQNDASAKNFLNCLR